MLSLSLWKLKSNKTKQRTKVGTLKQKSLKHSNLMLKMNLSKVYHLQNLLHKLLRWKELITKSVNHQLEWGQVNIIRIVLLRFTSSQQKILLIKIMRKLSPREKSSIMIQTRRLWCLQKANFKKIQWDHQAHHSLSLQPKE